MANNKISLPQNFLLEITSIPGSSDEVCEKAIAHYGKFLTYPDPIVMQIASAMVGNLTEYYNISHQGSLQFELAIPHLSGVANFMDSKNSPNMDIQSTARIKSFYSTYEKLLMECSNKLENNEPIPTSGLAKDLIATRDVLYPRYQLKNNPQAFYKHTYKAILEFMDYIDALHEQNPEYGFERVSDDKRAEIARPKKIIASTDDDFAIPEHDFISYALEIRDIPEIYRKLVDLKQNLSQDEIKVLIRDMKNLSIPESAHEHPLAKLLKAKIKELSLLEFRNELEQELIDHMSDKMYEDYTQKSREDFLYINKPALRPEYRDYITVIDAIDSSIQYGSGKISLEHLTISPTSVKVLQDKLAIAGINQHLIYISEIAAIRRLDLDKFDEYFAGTEKIMHYDECCKDYMRSPKQSGYQSFHISVKTPFGYYEKQFRTEAQHNHAEYGAASHSKAYKPYEKENFHRLKVPTPLMPARDIHGDIMTPMFLLPVSFGEAVREYYHKDFEFFSGVPMDVFETLYPNKEAYDAALFNLSQSTGSMLKRLEKKFSVLTNWMRKKPPKSTDDSDPFNR